MEAAGYPVTPFDVTPERQAAAEPLRLEILPGGRVLVRVWDEAADAPCAGCTVDLLGSARGPLSLSTDAEGAVLSPLLAPGRYSVTVERVRSLGSVVNVHGGDDQRFVEIEPHKTVVAELGERRRRVQVAFSPPPPPGWRLLAAGSDSVSAIDPSADGTFVVRPTRGEEMVLSLCWATITTAG